jgi:hypothetical protein
MTMSRDSGERGFALPATLFVIALVTIMLSGVFVRASVDRRLAESSGDYVDAFALAQSGLQRYMHYYDSLGVRPLDGDSLRINGVGGYADVVAHVARRPLDSLDNWTYALRSTGRLIEPTQGEDPQAERTVAQLTRWQSGSIRRVATFVSVDPIDCCGTMTVVVNGSDECSADVIGGFRGPSGSDAPGSASGSPALNLSGSSTDILAELGIDWQAVVNGEFVADHPAAIDGDTTYASYFIDMDPGGNYGLSDFSGTGLLMVEGELDTGGSNFTWDGIILVGDEFDAEADNTTVHGIVIEGLNRLLGLNPENPDLTMSGATLNIRYNSCEVSRTLESLTGFVPVPNAWIDNWATY